MINIKKLMLYGGIEAESYKEVADNIKEENRKSLRMYVYADPRTAPARGFDRTLPGFEPHVAGR